MTPMRRILSFRDFDWPMLAMVLALCTISVLEIYSATLHTKYTGSIRRPPAPGRRWRESGPGGG